MSNFLIEELSHRVNRIRDDQARTNTSLETRIKELQDENKEVRNRLTVLTRLLIARQIATAEEIATALAASLAPPPKIDEQDGTPPALAAPSAEAPAAAEHPPEVAPE